MVLLVGQAFGWDWDVREDKPSLAATKELSKKMLTLMKAGKSLNNVIGDTRYCFADIIEADSTCYIDDVVEDARHFTYWYAKGSQNGKSRTATVYSIPYAFYLAAEEYFKDANGLPDYKRMIQFYNKHKGDAENDYFFGYGRLMNVFGYRKTDLYAPGGPMAYAASILIQKAYYPKAQNDAWLKNAPLPRATLRFGSARMKKVMDYYYGLAKTKYKDVDSFKQLKKRLFYDMIVYGNHEDKWSKEDEESLYKELGNEYFWKAFAVSPGSFTAAEQKELKKMIQQRYTMGLARWSKKWASVIKEQAAKNGYWDQTEESKKALLKELAQNTPKTHQ